MVEVQLWCLQTRQDIIWNRYTSMSPEEKFFVRKSVFSMACSEPIDDENVARVLESPAYMKNKLAQVLVTLIYFEYLLIWSSIFTDFLPHLSKGSVVIDMFCRVLSKGRLNAKGKRNSLRRGRLGRAIQDFRNSLTCAGWD
ncbi:hypothetical protein I3843_04G114600 [Carya illinoinensis]|nr:hypothetical protein I3843_04G114600 [Carya illinoinensis]